MLTKRVIPCLDVDKGRVVKGVNFCDLVDAGDPIELAQAYDLAGADEIVFLDITATHEARKSTVELAARASYDLHIPCTVGGGFSDTDGMREMLSAGAEKISVNSAAVRRPELISEAAQRFGSQAVIVAIDAKRVDCPVEEIANPGYEPKWRVHLNGGRVATELDVVQWAAQAAELGAGEILLTSMDRDGSKDGYDVELTKKVTQAVNIPVIASGGAGKLEDFSNIVLEGGASAVLAASLFHFNELKIREVKEHMAGCGIPVRLDF